MRETAQDRDGEKPLKGYVLLPTLNVVRSYLDNFLNKPGPSTGPDFVPGPETIDRLEKAKILSVSKPLELPLPIADYCQGHV